MIEISSVFDHLQFPGIIIHHLQSEDETRIQSFLESCEDFSILESGRAPLPGDGKKFLQDMPPGKLLEDKIAFSLEKNNEIIGLVDLVKDYPEVGIWWIGLLLLHPASRGNRSGSQVVRGIVSALVKLEAREIRLGVLEENKDGYAFWQRMGFKHFDTKPNRRFGEKIHTVIVMQKIIGL